MISLQPLKCLYQLEVLLGGASGLDLISLAGGKVLVDEIDGILVCDTDGGPYLFDEGACLAAGLDLFTNNVSGNRMHRVLDCSKFLIKSFLLTPETCGGAYTDF